MSSSTLFRLSGLAGILSGSAFIIDQVLIDMLWADSLIANTIGFLSSVLGLYALTGLYLYQREASGSPGMIGYALNFSGLTLLVGVVFANNYILSQLSEEAVEGLFAGPTRLVFVVIAVFYLIGVAVFGVAIIRAGRLPRLAAWLYMLGWMPVALAPFFPDLLVTIGAVLAGGSIAWFGYALWSDKPTTATTAAA